MEKPINRMDQPMKRKEVPPLQDAPPVVIPGRVMPCICPGCGKGMSPVVRQTLADKGYSRVECACCKAKLVYRYATIADPMPRVRLSMRNEGIASMP